MSNAVIEFEVVIDGLQVNNGGQINWNGAGQIVEFEVVVHQPMTAAPQAVRCSARTSRQSRSQYDQEPEPILGHISEA